MPLQKASGLEELPNMIGQIEDSLPVSGWYLIAGDGDVVLRVRRGMKLGEDSAGELSFQPGDAEVELDIGEDGGLIVLACSNHALEVEPGKKTRRVEASRRCRVQVHLIGSHWSIDTDFARTSRPEGRLEIRVIRTEASGRGLVLVPEAARSQGAGTRPRRISRRAAWGWAACTALGSAIVLAGVYAIFQAGPESPSSGARAPIEPGEVTANAPTDRSAAGPSSQEPSVARALASISALLESTEPPSEPSLEVALQALKALSVAYPKDLQIKSTLQQVSERLDIDAPLRDAPVSEDSHEKSTRVTPAVAEAAPPPRSLATLPIEPVRPSLARHRTTTDDADTARAVSTQPAPREKPGAASVEQDAQPGVQAASTEGAPSDVTWEGITEAVESIALRRDLEAAAETLDQSFLMQPPADIDFAGYSRVLEPTPDSPTAGQGIELIQKSFIARAREHIASQEFEAALASLEDADTAGVDPLIVDDLRSEATYRQRLINARAGRFEVLYPITDLKVIRQELPVFPGYSAAGIEQSVEIEMTVSETGEVSDVEVLGDPPRRFARAARQAVSKWRFEPVLEQGRPMPVRTAVRMTFRDH